MSDDIRKTLSDPKPLYALAGAGDLAAEKLKDAPDRFKDAPAKLAEASAALSTLATRIAAEAPEHLARVSATVQDTVGKAARPDAAALRDRAQTVALQQVGRLLEAAGKAVETYDELAERGKVVVGRYTGAGEGGSGEAGEPAVTVVVEQLSDEDELTGAEHASATLPEDVFDLPTDEAQSAAEAAAVFIAAEEVSDEAGAADPTAPKRAARKRASAPKAPRTADDSEA
ncbi:hypothetical protein KDL01_09875 [Actinospica durhamensis]|uniref:Heparin binding hemagglutinin HbhA n=1 Tax=Actinospica durhamensis TaxID=1508375 RepID=A0A941ER34_9ACTN|nr:hypothetical protein [Actinospica durhamensis]MBR7833574.1 hypothetical protein [Actinospica durhamensis]